MKKRNPILSVIVPVYKVQYDLLIACLESLLTQKCDEAEVIVIDDGSPDECGRICDSLCDEDERFCVYHFDNRGVSFARNEGINLATGEYLLFVDGDDVIVDGFLDDLALRCASGNEDVIFFGCTKKSTFQIIDYSSDIRSLPSALAIAESIIARNEDALGFPDISFGSPWGKAYRRNALIDNRISFPKSVKRAQDCIFNISFMATDPTCGFFGRLGYVYTDTNDSASRKLDPNIELSMRQTASSMRDAIMAAYTGSALQRMLDCFPMFEYALCENVLLQKIFHKDFEADIRQRRFCFYRFCLENERLFSAILVEDMAGRKNKIVLQLLRTRHYGIAFYLLYCLSILNSTTVN